MVLRELLFIFEANTSQPAVRVRPETKKLLRRLQQEKKEVEKIWQRCH